MLLQQRIDAFSNLGKVLLNNLNNASQDSHFATMLHKAEGQNPWFTKENSRHAIEAICGWLTPTSLQTWLSKYLLATNNKNIGVVMAGNIPLVGFHDALCILISGNNLNAKLSSKDTVLMQYILNELIAVEPIFADKIQICTLIKNVDAIITTGSNNSSRYFEYYFNKYPHIIRKNRNSVAILTGEESEDELQSLGRDIFSYFGLGCRNVSKVYIPEGYDITKLIDQFEMYSHITMHNKYMNNYEYNKSIYLITRQEHLDNGFLLCTQDSKLSSPLAVLFYENYSSTQNLKDYLTINEELLQCVVCKPELQIQNSIAFGQTQSPNLWDYADSIDTITFLQQTI